MAVHPAPGSYRPGALVNFPPAPGTDASAVGMGLLVAHPASPPPAAGRPAHDPGCAGPGSHLPVGKHADKIGQLADACHGLATAPWERSRRQRRERGRPPSTGSPGPTAQNKRKQEEHERPMTTMALIIPAAAPAGPRKLTPAQLTVDDAQCQALFASSLQRSDAPGADAVTEAIRLTVQQLGTDGCTGRMAQEFGDHPEAASERMRWVRSLLICHRDDHSPHGRTPWLAARRPNRAMPKGDIR